ncbi:HAD-IIIC family phosphatase [Sellimonas intestinalis]|uniref:HAD-IIIC family phosphatase n=1 Tax=Sellimonas intestinalis TaxID=1653434 RepID=UPI0015EBC50B|nr:HAD-IIIC family phosphatase [Sellimonas intestinalis]MBA2213308.1 HAD-IIIC family phosphatase [Sellimonas intestinalis]
MKKKEIKCVIWDLDNTVWNGILTEDKEVILREEVKKAIIELDGRGILNSISSKNNFDDTLKKLEQFGLSKYFLYPEINWNSKSSSVNKIVKNLNIGMDTILFVDDSEFERNEVQSVYPEVMIDDGSDIDTLLSHERLNPKIITIDAKKRRQMYLESIERKNNEDNFIGTNEEFLKSIDMRFSICEATKEDLIRVQELTIRTHQLNSTGVTYSFDELDEFMKSKNHKLYICELADKFGSYGKIGIALVETGKEWHLKLLLMSCRVMNRGVGTVLLSYIMTNAKKNGAILLADFKQTERNKVMYVSYKFSNFKERSNDGNGNILFENDLSIIPKIPKYITLITD